jgi:acetylornithine deacetylase
MSEALRSVRLEEEAFVSLLAKLIKETPKLQNAPPALVPQEDLAAAHVMAGAL